ncbi:MAG: flavin reductase domain protein FMN-binding protein [Polaromonas sp.]|nr:flavin reductase domain protein FMN-binding protein [Polaromonas sp.]
MYSWAPISGDLPQTLDAQRFRRALGGFPTGVCLVTTVAEDGKREGMTVNSFSSVSLSPPLILWSIRDDARSSGVFLAARSFVLSVLSDAQADLAMHFAKPAADKFSWWEASFGHGLDGCPRLLESVATYECTTYSRYQEGDHTLLLGRVNAFSSSDLQPLMFHAGRMGSLQELAALASSAK